MTIDEAIGILEEEGAIAKLHKATGKAQALLLGVEALEAAKEMRRWYSVPYVRRLPSETEEQKVGS